MAKQKKTQVNGYNSKPFIIAAIALALVSFVSSLMVGMIYTKTTNTFQGISQQSQFINRSSGELSKANEIVLQVVAGVGDMQENIEEIQGHFRTIDALQEQYMALEGVDEASKKRFQHAIAYIDAYDQKMIDYREMLTEYSEGMQSSDETLAATYTMYYQQLLEQMPTIYQQEIRPLQTSATEMMAVSVSLASKAASIQSAKSVRYVWIAQSLLIALLIAGEITLYLIARSTKRANEEIERKNAQFAEASSKLMRSREKMEDLAAINLLTGMKNRYSLEQDIGERLASEYFNIALFNLDNFRSINDLYGYDFGDEYLAQIAERLKAEYGQYAEIYNITGDEFCFVFNREVSDTQALRFVESIAASMSSPYTVMNLTVQLPVSGSTYHYVAGDCLNLNSLLVKMNAALRNAKLQGGGQVHQVMNI